MNATLLLLALAATTSGAGQPIDRAVARRAANAAPATAVAERMQQHAADGATDALVNTVRSVLADPAIDTVARELLAEKGLTALRRLTPTPAARALARELSTRAPRVYTRVEPEHGRHAVPLYDPGASARFALREWARLEARAAATQSLRLGTSWALDAYVADDAPTAFRDGVVDAYTGAGAEELLRQRPALLGAMRDGRDVDRIALAMARRLRDPELLALTIGHAEPAVALDAIRTADRDLDTGAALQVLGLAADREPVASAALLAIGRIAKREPAALDLLLERIADPVSGESAAAALAATSDPALVPRLGARLHAAQDEATRRRLALALRLDDSAAARRELARLVADKRGSSELRKEVAAWLARTR